MAGSTTGSTGSADHAKAKTKGPCRSTRPFRVPDELRSGRDNHSTRLPVDLRHVGADGAGVVAQAGRARDAAWAARRGRVVGTVSPGDHVVREDTVWCI